MSVPPRGALPSVFLLLLFVVNLLPSLSWAQADYPGLLQVTGTHPTATVQGDFNADGVVDLATVSYSTHSVSIFLANTAAGFGDGSFRLASTFVVGEEPWDIAAGDLNNDGAMDLVVTEGLANRFSVWIANTPGGIPDGSFFPGPTPGVWQYPVSVLFEDLNGDGNDDIAVANYWSDNVSLFYGDGAGGFSGNAVLDAGSRPIDLVTGDFNNDGIKDLAVVDFLSDNLAMYLGGIDGSLNFHEFIDAGGRPVAAAVGTMTDGIDDIAVANYYNQSIGLLVTSPEATERGDLFEPCDFIETPGSPRAVMLKDLNSDSFPELVYTLEDIDQLAVSVGHFVGSFDQPVLYDAGYRPMGVLAAKIDGDDFNDLVVTSHWSHGFIVLDGAGLNGIANANFNPGRLESGSVPLQVVLDDLNGDSFLDLITMNGSGRIRVSKGQDGPVWFNFVPGEQKTGSDPVAMVTANLTTDNFPEVISIDSELSLLSVFEADPADPSLLKPEVRVGVGLSPTDVVSADFDRDGVNDLMSYSADTGRLDFYRINLQSSINVQSFKTAISIAVGPSDANGDVDLTLESPGPGAETGFVVAMGDANADGIADVLVGSPGDDTVRLYYGAAVLDQTPNMVFTGSQPGERFGAAVAFGDLDNDGADDILVGAPANDSGASGAGMVYVFLGNQDAAADLTRGGSQADEGFGTAVASGSDLNGDGVDDWAVTSPGYDGTGVDAGRVLVFWGNALDAGEDLVFEGEAEADFFGSSVALTGDFTANGHSDLVVGAPGHGETQATAGRIYVYAGGAMSTTPAMVADGEAITAKLGSSVAGVGDYNSDGFMDIGAGAPFFDTESGLDRGQVSLYFGGPEFDSEPDLVWAGRKANALLGSSIATAGDPNGQGKTGFMASAPGYIQVNSNDPTASQFGRVYLIEGGLGSTSEPLVIASGNVSSAGYGAALAGGRDFNGDGFDDWVVGAPENTTAGAGAGVAFVYKGGAGGIPGPGNLATGDFDGDGGVDLVATNKLTNELSILLNDPDESFVGTDSPISHVMAVDDHPAAISTGDVDGDGDIDLAVLRETQEDAVIYFGNGDGSFSAGPPISLGPSIVGFDLVPSRVYLEDVDGDNVLDLIAVISAWGGVSISHGAGDGTFQNPALYVSAALASDAAFGDISHNGFMDMVITDQLRSLVAVHLNRGGSTGNSIVTAAPSTPAMIAPLLAQNYPNPFNPKTEIRYDLPVGGRASLEVFDIRGRKVKTLVEAQLPAGSQKAVWDGRDADGGEVAAGVYLYRLAVNGEIMGQRKMVLVK